MKKVCLAVVSVLLISMISHAQEVVTEDVLMRFFGMDSLEELDPDDAERIADYIEHPLRINVVPESRLLASGLLTGFQVASLTDYRRRHGNVVSYMELASVDGFTSESVSILRHVISLECSSLHDPENQVQNDIAVRSAFRHVGQNTDCEWNYGLKYRLKTDRLSFSIAASRPYSAVECWPDAYSGSLAYDFRRFRGRVVIGDFNARFGQGLSLWSGTFMTSLNSPDAFMKKASGISETWSFTGSSALTGIAGSFSMGRFVLNMMAAMPEIKSRGFKFQYAPVSPAANLSWRLRNGSISLTHAAELTGFSASSFRIPVMRTSGDVAFCFKGVNAFGEVAYDWVSSNVNTVLGTDFGIGETGRIAALVKYLPDKYNGTVAQHGTALSASIGLGRMVAPSGADGFGTSRRSHTATFSVDVVRYIEPKAKDVPLSAQLKLVADWRFLINSHWEVKLRFYERLRNWGHRSRTDLRTDIVYMYAPFVFAVRLNALQCVSHAFVGYSEQGYRNARMSVFLRQGVFLVDDWEDRIYVYERDAPGSFNVPAMYGRGWFANMVLSARMTDAVRLYLRASYTGYDLMPYEKRKPGKAELKVQLVLRYL